MSIRVYRVQGYKYEKAPNRRPKYITMIVEWVRGLEIVGSDHSMASCLICTQGNSASTNSIHEAMD